MRYPQVLLEYVCIDGVNDSMEDAQRLLKLTATIPCKVNLGACPNRLICDQLIECSVIAVPFNAHSASPGMQPSAPERVQQIRNFLNSKGLVTTVK